MPTTYDLDTILGGPAALLENRVTTNETGISGLDTRVTTAEGNITAAQSDISDLQAGSSVTIYDSVATLMASTDTFTAGTLVGVRKEGFVYEATGETDNQVVNAGGQKFYVLPKDGKYYFAAWNVDGTGATSVRTEFLAAGILAAKTNTPLLLTQPDLLIEGNNLFFEIPNRNTLTIQSTVGTRIRLDHPNILFRHDPVFAIEDLAADVPYRGTQVTVADTSSVGIGDFVKFFSTQERIDTNWNYKKYTTRRVARILSPTVIELDQPMVMKYDRYEGNAAGDDRAVTGVTLANPGVVTVTSLNRVEGDYIRFEQVVGMPELANTVFRVGPVSGSTFTLHDEANSPVDTTAFEAFTSASVMKQEPVTVEIHAPAKVRLDNITFLVGVEKHAITGFDPATNVLTTATDHGMSTGAFMNLSGLVGTVEANDKDFRIERLSPTTLKLRDLSNVEIDTTGWTAYTSGGHLYTSNQIDFESSVGFEGIEGTVTRCEFIGPVPYWNTGSVDLTSNVHTDNFVYDQCLFKRGRYCPLIQAGSRNTRITRSVADRVRHIEVAGWAEDTLIEDVVGVDTHGIIQTHPCTNTVWRRVRDWNTSGSTSAINLRGTGETIEDCEAEMSSGLVGVGTNNYTPHYLYLDWAKDFTRRITGLKSHTVAPSAAHGPFIVERCKVPYISAGPLDGSSTYVDDKTEALQPLDRSLTSMFNGIIPQKRVNVPKLTEYVSEILELDITNITQANPPVITSVGHGLKTGQVILVEDVLGMTEMNGRVQTATYIDDDNFSMTFTNATGYGAYTGGGKCWAYSPDRVISGITQANPAVVTTSTDHEFSNGDVIWLSGVSGMTNVNTSYFKVANVTATTFELTDLDDVNVDSSGYGAYTSGGKATKQKPYSTLDVANKLNTGLGETCRTTTRLYSESAYSGGTIEVPVFMRFHSPGAISSSDKFHAQLKLKAYTRGGYAEAVYDIVADFNNGAGVYNYGKAGPSHSTNTSAVSLSGISFRALGVVKSEGETSSANAMTQFVNHRWGATGKITVTLSSGWLVSLDAELDVQRVEN